MKPALVLLGVACWVQAVSAQEEGTTPLEDAREGMAEASWPKKPDQRLSPLSGKIKDISSISPRYYGKGTELSTKTAEGWHKESPLRRKANAVGGAGHNWEEARWSQHRDATIPKTGSDDFPFPAGLASDRTMKTHQVERESADWSTRSARLGRGWDGSPLMYQGRLTRVREQVWEESQDTRDLGSGRKEKFTPAEVEKILSQPVGELRGAAREQSPTAFPLATADN